MARRAIEAGELVPLLGDFVTLGPNLFALCSENRRLSAKIRVFVDFLMAEPGTGES